MVRKCWDCGKEKPDHLKGCSTKEAKEQRKLLPRRYKVRGRDGWVYGCYFPSNDTRVTTLPPIGHNGILAGLPATDAIWIDKEIT